MHVQPPPTRPPLPPTDVYLLVLTESHSCCGNASRVFNPSVSQWANSCVWLENKSIPRRWSQTCHKFLDANWGFSRIRTSIWEVSYLQLLIQQCRMKLLPPIALDHLHTLQALCCCSCTHKMVDSPLLGCTKWPPHCGADSRAVTASVRLSHAFVPIKDLHLCDALFQHRIEHFTHTDVTLRIHTALFYYSFSMSHRDPRGFLMSLTWMCILMSAFPISVAPKKVQKGTKKCPHVIPARSNRGLGIWGKSEARSKSRKASVCV